MPRKRIARHQRKPRVDPSLAALAAVLEQIQHRQQTRHRSVVSRCGERLDAAAPHILMLVVLPLVFHLVCHLDHGSHPRMYAALETVIAGTQPGNLNH